MQILDFLSQNGQGLTLTELSELVDLPRSSVHALLFTLTDMNYIRREDHSGLYFIGLKTFEVGSRYVENNDVYRSAKDVLEQVSIASHETAHLAVLDGREVVYVCKHDSDQAIRMISYVGKRVPAHATAVGKALLTGLSNAQLRAMYGAEALPRLTERTVTDVETLIGQVENARVTGTAYEREESTPNVQCVAVPIQNRSGIVLMGMSISVPIFRSGDSMQPYIEILLEGKHRLEMMIP